ncbi:MAG: IS607 family transposase [Acidimicrobiales bacterium]|jgi:putative resolvase
MKLAEWARSYGVHPNTAYRWFADGTLPVPARRLASGTIVVEQKPPNVEGGRTVAYCRVSSHDQRDDLARQATAVSRWASQHGHSVDEVVTEVGSGLGATRPRLARLLADAEVARIVVEHQDRLARFGVEHLRAALAAQGRQILVIDDGEVDTEYVRDMTEVLTSLCARLYGRRGARNRALRALTAAKNAEVT